MALYDPNTDRYSVHYSDQDYDGTNYEEAIKKEQERRIELDHYLIETDEYGNPAHPILHKNLIEARSFLQRLGLAHTYARGAKGAVCIGSDGEPVNWMDYKAAFGPILRYDTGTLDKWGNPKYELFDPTDGYDSYKYRYNDAEKPIWNYNYFRPYKYYDGVNFNGAHPYVTFRAETSEGYEVEHQLLDIYFSHICEPEVLNHFKKWLLLKFLHPEQHIGIALVMYGEQGIGKSTFFHLCNLLFGTENVVSRSTIDIRARFNGEWATSVVLGIEESTGGQYDSRGLMSVLKDMITNPQLTYEKKFEEAVVLTKKFDIVIASNDIALQIPGGQQRRFIMARSDPTFKNTPLAEQTFQMIYGLKPNSPILRTYLRKLSQDEKVVSTDIYKVPHGTQAEIMSAEYTKNDEQNRIDYIINGIAPLIKASFDEKRTVESMLTVVDGEEVTVNINAYMPPGSIHWVKPYAGNPMRVYVRLKSFLQEYSDDMDPEKGRPIRNALVKQRIASDLQSMLRSEWGLNLVIESKTHMFPHIRGWGSAVNLVEALTFEPVVIQSQQALEGLHQWAQTQEITKQGSIQDGVRCSLFMIDPRGDYESINPVTGIRSSANVASMANFLFEADNDPLDVQEAEAERLLQEGKVNRVVFSGLRSFHMRVTVADAPTTVQEYKWLWSYLASTLSNRLTFDPACSDPSRLTRYPYKREEGKYRTDWKAKGLTEPPVAPQCDVTPDQYRNNVLQLPWRSVYERCRDMPVRQDHKINIPMKQEYREALDAIINGTFWVNPDFDGRRQVLFLPAYRLLRYIGYTHEEIEALVEVGTEGYKDPRHFITFTRNLKRKDVGAEYDEDHVIE